MDGASGRKTTTVSALFTQLGLLFVQGRISEMTAYWTFPCPVEVEGQLVVMRDASDLARFFAERRAGAMEAGLTAFEPRIAAIEMPRAGRFRVWLRWALTFGNVCLMEEQVSLYYMARKPRGGLTIEMMDIVLIPLETVPAATA